MRQAVRGPQVAYALLSTIAVVAALVHVELVHYYIANLWKRGFWAAMTAAFVAVVVWVRLVKCHPAETSLGGRSSHPGARRDLDRHPAPCRARRLQLRPGSVWLAEPQPLGVRVYAAPVLVLFQCRRGRPGPDDYP